MTANNKNSNNGTTPWWKGAVVYQIYPRSYLDTKGSGIGDLDGIRRKLDYIADLGVDAIWLSPIFPSPNRDFGYDVSDYCGVAPEMGDLDGFDRLLAEAHERGLKLILDQVLAHSSDQHAWFGESLLSRDNDKADWYVWADAKADGTPPNNWMSAFGGPAWSWHPLRRQYYHHKFLKQQPKLNFHEPAVVKALMDVLRFWLDRGVDGFRLDVAHAYIHDAQLQDNPPTPMDDRTWLDWAHAPRLQQHVHDSGLADNRWAMEQVRAVMNEYPDRMAFGEFAETPKMIGTYAGEPDRLHSAYTFDFLEDRSLAPSLFENYYSDVIGGDKGPWPCVTFSNHDITRPVTRWGGGKGDREGDDDLAKFGIALLLGLKGTALMYQGEELGLPDVDLGPEDICDPVGDLYFPYGKGRDGCRTPMPWAADEAGAGFTTGRPWLPIPEYHLDRAVGQQLGDSSSVLSFTRSVIAFRKTQKALRAGDIKFLTIDGILAFERSLDGERVLCLFNSGTKPVSIPTDVAKMLSSGEWGEPLFELGRLESADGTVTMPPRGAFFFRRA
ncbi:MAG: alpha-glucosidase family protein [Parvibaculum sp.]